MTVAEPRFTAVAVLALLAGCTSPQLASGPSPTPPDYPVVAIIDSGINPYHTAFASNDPALADFIASLRDRQGRPPSEVQLSGTGDYASRIAADRRFWEAAEPGRLYWFVGTRVLALSSDVQGAVAVLDEEGHGTSVASVIREVSPVAVILVVETVVAESEPPESMIPTAVALQHLTGLDWVDVVSLSIGPAWGAERLGSNDIAKATMALAEEGKLLVVAAGNQPNHPATGATAGPPWVMSVTGGRNDSYGRTIFSAQAEDLVSDYYKPRAASEASIDDYHEGLGTSYAAPTVAGVAARALDALRASGASVVPSELRPLLNQTAVYWNLTDWTPVEPHPDPLQTSLRSTVPVANPWLQMGWGYVGPEHADLLAQAYLGTWTPPPKPPEAVEYMAAQHQARIAYWDARLDGQAEPPPDPAPPAPRPPSAR